MTQPTKDVIVWALALAGAVLVSAVVHSLVDSPKRAHVFSAIAFTLITFVGDVVIRSVLDGWWIALGPILYVICYVTSIPTGAVMDKLGWSARTRRPRGTD